MDIFIELTCVDIDGQRGAVGGTPSRRQKLHSSTERPGASDGRTAAVSALYALFHETAALTATASLLYGGILAVVALTSVLARTSERRRDARSTLAILIRKRRSG